MLTNEEHFKRLQLTFSYDDEMPDWEKESLHEQRFDNLNLPIMQRIGVGGSQYNICSSDTECKVVDAQTAAMAMDSSGIEAPTKIEHLNCRLDDIIAKEKLEIVEINAAGGVESSEEAKTEEPKPEPEANE